MAIVEAATTTRSRPSERFNRITWRSKAPLARQRRLPLRPRVMCSSTSSRPDADHRQHYNEYLKDHSLSPADPGVAVGATAAAGIIALRANDGRFRLARCPLSAVATQESGVRRLLIGTPPVRRLFRRWLLGGWPMSALRSKSGDQFRPGPPPPLTSPSYTRDYNEVQRWERGSIAPEAMRRRLGLFWASNYPALWNRALRDIAEAQNLNIGDSARLFALVNLAMADAIVTAWDSKVAYVLGGPLLRFAQGTTIPIPIRFVTRSGSR